MAWAEFGKDWFDEIAEVTGDPEYQRATIRITTKQVVNPNDYDVETDTYTGPPPETRYEGRARIIGVRWGTESSGEQANRTTISAIRIQIPQHAVSRIERGFPVTILSAPENNTLETRVFTITSDMQGSSAASRTFEAALDGDSKAGA